MVLFLFIVLFTSINHPHNYLKIEEGLSLVNAITGCVKFSDCIKHVKKNIIEKCNFLKAISS